MTGIRIPLYIQVCHIVYRGSTVFKIYCHSDTFLNEHIKVIPTSPFPHIPLYWGAFRYLYVLSGISVAFRYFGCFPVFDRTLFLLFFFFFFLAIRIFRVYYVHCLSPPRRLTSRKTHLYSFDTINLTFIW